jgi:hypothetical protein
MSAGITNPTYKVNKCGDLLISAAYSFAIAGKWYIVLFKILHMNLSANVQIHFSWE